MLIYNKIFANASEFAEKFGTPKCRKNKLGIAVLLSKLFLDEYKLNTSHGFDTPMWTPQLAYCEIMSRLSSYEFSTCQVVVGTRVICIPGTWKFKGGITSDINPALISYQEEVGTRNGYEWKTRNVKAGRFIKTLIEWKGLKLSPALLNFVCEEFAHEWKTFVEGIKNKELTLRVSSSEDAFERAYDNDNYHGGSFGSCMENQDLHTFYTDSVNASVATLEDADGIIYARCVIFNSVRDEDTNETLVLAERQYAYNEIYKRILVNRLIEGEYIDGYKVVGAGCHNNTAFVSNKGEDWSNRDLSIKCTLEYGEILSYQDSFVYYDMDKNRAYNTRYHDYCETLNTTDGSIGEWDTYHERGCEETRTVYVHGVAYNCDVDDLEDFRKTYVRSGYEYHHVDDIVWSEYEKDYILEEDAVQLHDESYVFRRDAKEVAGEWYLYKDVAMCDNCGEKYVIKDGVSESPSYNFCSDECKEEWKKNREEDEE